MDGPVSQNRTLWRLPYISHALLTRTDFFTKPRFGSCHHFSFFFYHTGSYNAWGGRSEWVWLRSITRIHLYKMRHRMFISEQHSYPTTNSTSSFPVRYISTTTTLISFHVANRIFLRAIIRVSQRDASNSLEQCPPWETESRSAGKEIDILFLDLSVHYCAQKISPLDPILNHFNPIHTLPISLRFIVIFSSHIHSGLPSSFFPSGFPAALLYVFLIFRVCGRWPAHLILPDLITLIVSHKEYEF
jgi:hypothetical protein